MQTRLRLAAAALCCAAMLAGCGSVTGDLAFKAPDGWTATPAIFGRVQMWIKPSQVKGRQEMLMLAKGDASQAKTIGQSGVGARDLHDLKRTKVVLCGAQPATYMTGTGYSRNDNKPDIVEMMSATVAGTAYTVVYVRPEALPADPQAESALHSLCQK